MARCFCPQSRLSGPSSAGNGSLPRAEAEPGIGLLRSGVALKGLSTAQTVGLAFAAVFYVAAGALHFLNPAPCLRIVPPYIPWHLPLVLISGGFEILGGLGLLVPRVRRNAAWGPPAVLWLRLPLQILLIWWLLWCTRARAVLR
jgi:uncharacterized membrane protein